MDKLLLLLLLLLNIDLECVFCCKRLPHLHAERASLLLLFDGALLLDGAN
jgi:hypothetical protein